VKTQDIKLGTTKNLVGIALLKPILDDIGIREIADKYCSMERSHSLTNGDALNVMILNRLTSPAPLYRVEKWADNHALLECCGIESSAVNDDKLGRALDSIFPHIEEIESEISLRIISKYHIKPELVHFDASSIYFEGAYEESELLRLGYSRDQKPDKKQINVDIDVDAKEGMPLFHTIHKGNTPDPVMSVQNLIKIKERLKPEKMIMVGDRTAISGQVAFLLRDYNLDFIGAIKMTHKTKMHVAEIQREKFQPLNEEYDFCETAVSFSYNSRKMDVRAIIIHGKKKSEHDRKKRERGIARIESKLKEIQSKLNTRLYKKEEYARKKIDDALSLKYGYLFNTTLTLHKDRLQFSYSVNQEALKLDRLLDGKYVLSTTLPWDAKKIFESYRSRYIVESRIRNMKNEIAVRPVFLHKDERICSLVFVSIISLMVYSLLEILARRSMKTRITTRSMLYLFEKVNIMMITLSDGQKIMRVEDLTPPQAEILDNLNLARPESYVSMI